MTFTEHVRNYGPDCDPAGCVLPRLEQVLRRQMARRHLLSAPPAYLGYPEHLTWSAPGAMEDLRVDCYLYAVARRIEGLRNQLVVRADVDGLIVVNVRNFLFERQRQNDRRGYATFGNVEAAVTALEGAGELTVERRVGGRLDGSSIVRLRASDPGAVPADPGPLEAALAAMPGWVDALPHLAGTTEQGQEWVAGYLRALAAAGVARVRVSDLVAVLAARVRTDWEARNSAAAGEVGFEGDGEFARLVRLVRPDAAADERDQWAMWKRVVPERIARVEDAVLRDRLGGEFAALVRMIEGGGVPSQSDLTRDLGLTRSTVSRDFARLREIVEDIAGGPGTPTADGG